MLMQQTMRTGLADSVDLERLKSGVQRLVAARYFSFLMGAALLSWLAAQAFILDGAPTAFSAFLVASTSVLGPGVIWIASSEQLDLRRALLERSRLLEQERREKRVLTSQLHETTEFVERRRREIKALNRLAQGHLAVCPALNSGAEEEPAYSPEVPHKRDFRKEFALVPLILATPDFSESAVADGSSRSNYAPIHQGR